MAQLANIARMKSETQGTANIVLDEPATGFITFDQAGVEDGSTVSYSIVNAQQTEVGRGVYDSGVLTRNVINSTNNNAKINLVGSSEVFVTALAEDFEDLEAAINSFIPTFNSRASAQNSIVPPNANHIIVKHAGFSLFYSRGDGSPGHPLVTLGGNTWKPDGVLRFEHFGAVGDGVTDDRQAIQDAVNFFGRENSVDAYNKPSTIFDCSERLYAIAGPIRIGNLSGGDNYTHNMKFQDMHLHAINGDWDGEIVAGVPKSMFVVAWRASTDDGFPGDKEQYLYRFQTENCVFNCNYLTNGIYLENTDSTTISDTRVDRLGPNKRGIFTSRSKFNQYVNATKNGALTIRNVFIQGFNPNANPGDPVRDSFPGSGSIGILIESNDFRIADTLARGVDEAIVVDNCGAGWIYDSHPWSRAVRIGPGATNINLENMYFDYDRVTLQSFRHNLISCNFALGSPDRTLVLEASRANETGKGLQITGCTFAANFQIEHTTSGSGSWAPVNEREYLMIAKHDNEQAAEVRHRFGKNMRVDSAGVTHFAQDDLTKGITSLYGSFMQLGADRTSNGYAGIELNNRANDSSGATLAVQGNGVTSLVSAFGDLILGTSGYTTAIRVSNSNGNVEVDNNFYAKSTAYLQGNAYVSRDLYVYDDLNVSDSFTVSGTVTMNGLANAYGDLRCHQDIIMWQNGIIGNLGNPRGALMAANRNYVDSRTSDERLKENITDINPCLSLIEQLHVIEFNYIDKNLKEERGTLPGLVAQEVREHVPSAIINRTSETYTDADGVEHTLEDPLGVDYVALVPLLIKAVQELSTRVRELEG